MFVYSLYNIADFAGCYSEGETPDPIPNSAVKTLSADDTATGGKVGRSRYFFQTVIQLHKALYYGFFLVFIC